MGRAGVQPTTAPSNPSSTGQTTAGHRGVLLSSTASVPKPLCRRRDGPIACRVCGTYIGNWIPS